MRNVRDYDPPKDYHCVATVGEAHSTSASMKGACESAPVGVMLGNVALLLRLSPSTYFSHCRGFPLIAMSHLLQHFLGSGSCCCGCCFFLPRCSRHLCWRGWTGNESPHYFSFRLSALTCVWSTKSVSTFDSHLKYWNFINVVFAGKILELCIRWQNNKTLYSCANCYSCISLPPFVLALQAIFNHDGRGSRELYCAISLAKWRSIGHNLVASPKIYTPLALG